MKREKCRVEGGLERAVAKRTRSRDISRKRRSREVQDQIFERTEYNQKDRSNSHSPQRLVGIKPKSDNFKKEATVTRCGLKGKS